MKWDGLTRRRIAQIICLFGWQMMQHLFELHSATVSLSSFRTHLQLLLPLSWACFWNGVLLLLPWPLFPFSVFLPWPRFIFLSSPLFFLSPGSVYLFFSIHLYLSIQLSLSICNSIYLSLCISSLYIPTYLYLSPCFCASIALSLSFSNSARL